MTHHNTGIEWTHIPGFKGETWNPVVGCEVISPGCTNCYAMRWAGTRMDGNPKTPHYAGTTMASKAGPVWTGKVAQAGEKTLTAPLRWAKPRALFVNSMGDLFHESVPDAWIDRVFAIMALCPQHVFIVLTKRAERMREYFREARDCSDSVPARSRVLGDEVVNVFADAGIPWNGDWNDRHSQAMAGAYRWPLRNVWLGVSVEDQARADERIPHLLATPAAVRFISAEPLLGPVDLERVGNLQSVTSAFPELIERLGRHMRPRQISGAQIEALGRRCQATTYYQTPDHMGGFEVGPRPYPRLDWVIAGGESGKGARAMHPDWARGLRDQCKAAAVPFFFKQWGEWAPTADRPAPACVTTGGHWATGDQCWELVDDADPESVAPIARVGRKAAGHVLEGETHHNWPEVAA